MTGRMTGRVLAALVFFVGAAHGQDAPVSWSLNSAAAERPLKPGGKFTAQLAAKIAPGWHLFSLSQPPGGPLATRVTLPEDQAFKLAGAIHGPPFKALYNTVFKMNTEVYEEEARFEVPVEARVDAAGPGGQKLLVAVRFQACSDTLCLLPKTVKLELEMKMAPPGKGRRR